jgi:O-antigen ligase
MRPTPSFFSTINKYNDKILSIAALFLGAAVPLLPVGIAVTQVALGLGLVLLLVVSTSEPNVWNTFSKLKFNPLTLTLAFMFAVWFATIPWSSDPLVSFTTILRTVMYLIGCAFIWAHLSIHKGFQHKTLIVLISLSSAMVFMACASLCFPDEIGQVIRSLRGNPSTVELHFKAYSSALLCSVPVLIWGGRRIGGNWRWLTWAMMPAILYVMLATQSRSSVAGLLIMLTIITVVHSWVNGLTSKYILAALMLAFTSVLTWVWFVGQRYTEISDNFLPIWLIDPHRQVIWRYVFKNFLEAPWTGYGVNRINFIVGSDAVRADVKGSLISAHPHNWILEILSETGVFGFSALVVVLVLLAWRLLAQYKKSNDIAVLTLIALCTAFFGSSLFNFSIWSTWWLLTFFFLFALVSVKGNTSEH